MTFEKKSLSVLADALDRLDAGFSNLPENDPELGIDYDRMQTVLAQTATRMQDNYPYHHPLYAGQMLKPPHPVARTAYAMAQWLNPNNHALDGGIASSAMEKEAVAALAHLFGWSEHLGHLTSGGTMANMEALWISRQLHPDKSIAVSAQSHYTHQRLSAVLELGCETVATDARGRMDIDALEKLLKTGAVGTVVVTLGTTGLGAIDPLPKILALQRKYGFRIHADAAYGGYFKLARNISPEAIQAFAVIDQVDSIVIDPHKHGLQPYGCGCVLFKDPSVGTHYQHDSPYTYFTSEEMHLGEISLECSRAGAAAVALWTTMKYLPLEPGGAFAKDLEKSVNAATELHARLRKSHKFHTLMPPELDIVVWALPGASASETSRGAQTVFDAAAGKNLHLALINLPKDLAAPYLDSLEWDCDSLTCLRSVLMKPEHLDWIDKICKILDACAP